MKYASGGLDMYSGRASAHAKQQYETVWKWETDHLTIAKNTGFSVEQVQAIKYYLFYSKHYLRDSIMTERFHPNFEIAESWRRLAEKDGKNIQPHDVLLLYHELYEIILLLNNPKMSQDVAHTEASKVYDYPTASYNYHIAHTGRRKKR